MSEKKDLEDLTIEELREKARLLAEATGRDEEDILADLIDDGVLNNSNKTDGKDLVEQLKEAAELISTVQNISKEVSENTVLNGGDNATEVKVETTLEGDIVDRAIESVQRKAENIKKIVMIVAPILLLLTGGVGLDFFLDEESNSNSDDYYTEIWGCTAPDADNYMPDATDDDGSCWWDDNNGGGGGPPDCFEDWRWDNVLIRDWDAHGSGYNDDIEVNVLFNDWNRCNRHMNQGFFEIKVINDENGQDYDTWSSSENFHDEFSISHHVYDVPEGEYTVRVDYYSEGSHWSGPSTLVTMEADSQICDDDIVINQLVLSANADDLNLYVEYQDNNGCGAPIEMQLAVYKNDAYQNYFIVSNNYEVQESGQTYFNINQDDNDIMRDVEDGDWKVEFRWWIIGEEENCCDMTNMVTVDEIEDSVPCDADIDNLQVSVFEREVSVIFYIVQHEGTDCSDWDIEINLMPVDDNGEEEITHEHSISPSSNYYSHTFNEVPNGDWQAKVILRQTENCASDCEIANEESSWVEVQYSSEPCDVEIQNHYRGHVADDEEQDAILVAFKVVPSNCEGEELKIDIELFQNGYDANYTHLETVSGSESTDVSHIFDGVAIGDSWTPRISACLEEVCLEQVLFWGIDVVAQEPEVCEINLFQIQIFTNDTNATIGFDLDCGESTNDLPGYNVSVQFLVYHVNESNSGPNATGPLQWVTQTYYIEGYVDDSKFLYLDNWSVNNTTHYDFYWYAIWEDAEGQQQFIERTWLNREVSA